MVSCCNGCIYDVLVTDDDGIFFSNSRLWNNTIRGLASAGRTGMDFVISQADEPISELNWSVEETTHTLRTYTPTEMQVYICSLCTHSGDYYIYYGNPAKPDIPSYGLCESRKGLEEMNKDPLTDEVALGFSIHPSGCYHILLNLFKFNNTNGK